MKVALYNQNAKEIEQIDLKDSVFKAELKKSVISQYVYSYLSNQRESNAQTKDRSEVSGGGVKPWRQKGTGRARFGSTRNPIWRKGGVAFGPTNDRNFKKKLTKKFKRAVLRQALSQALSDRMSIVDVFSVKEGEPLTKQALEITKAFGNPRKLVVVTGEVQTEVLSAFSNIDDSRVTFVGELSAYDVLNSGYILLDKKALEYLHNILG